MWERLEKFFKALDSKMTADKYYNLCEQMGQEPIEDEIPPDWTDLSYSVQTAINIYSKCGDRVISDIGFIGKDYSSLQILLDAQYIEDTEYVLDIVHWLEARQIKKSSDSLKKEQEKLKRKTSSGKKHSYP